MSTDYTIACYYFPNYHPDRRNERVHGSGWSEWELVKRAEPRFQHHRQPRRPQWGYQDEADPTVMAQKIDAAADHAINAFIFDWYWYDDGPFLERGLDEGFLYARNNRRLQFGLMWANHDWQDIHPAKLNEIGRTHVLYPGAVTQSTFEAIVDLVIERYFSHPAYWLIDGCPYFSIYDLATLQEGLGGLTATGEALRHFRSRVRASGFPDLHLNAVIWNARILPGGSSTIDPNRLVQRLGFDSITSYVWVHHGALGAFPRTDYSSARDRYLRAWEDLERQFDAPYVPNVTVGWDPSPRTVQSDAYLNAGYPFTPTLTGNTPERFREALVCVKGRIDVCGGPRIVTLNAWNEWTEGSYLEPDSVHGMAYLEAVRDVFGGQTG